LADMGSTTPSSSDASMRGMFLDRSKLPYGGVMDTSMMANAQQNQALALAMAERSQSLQAQRNLRNSRFAVAAPATTAATTTPAPQTTGTPSVPVEPETEAAMQNLLQELQAAKNVNQYKNAVQNTLPPDEGINITN